MVRKYGNKRALRCFPGWLRESEGDAGALIAMASALLWAVAVGNGGGGSSWGQKGFAAALMLLTEKDQKDLSEERPSTQATGVCSGMVPQRACDRNVLS